ncbi:MAG: DUF4395 family protein, partial [Thermoanaerobaculia bacterium]|nr:DUF4395 family protein [Thermoanaerobaculia bacterium]
MDKKQKLRKLVEMQGFTGLDDPTLTALEPWLRLSPFLCMIVTAVGTITGSAAIIFALVPFAVGGAILDRHPFDSLYHGLRRITDGPKIPRYGAPRRFSCGVAAVWLLATGSAFMLGAGKAGTALGLLFVLLAS